MGLDFEKCPKLVKKLFCAGTSKRLNLIVKINLVLTGLKLVQSGFRTGLEKFKTSFLEQIRRDQIGDQIAQWGLGKGLKVLWNQLRD